MGKGTQTWSGKQGQYGAAASQAVKRWTGGPIPDILGPENGLIGGYFLNRAGAYAGHAGIRSCRGGSGGFKSERTMRRQLRIRNVIGIRNDVIAANGDDRQSQNAHSNSLSRSQLDGRTLHAAPQRGWRSLTVATPQSCRISKFINTGRQMSGKP